MSRESITTVYQEYIWSQSYTDLAKKLYATPPITFGQNHERLLQVLSEYQKMDWHSDERMNRMKVALTKINRNLGCLTPKVKKNIENIYQGAIESAHQSVVLGGPAYILNKAATAERSATLNSTEERTFSPFFCVADYDIVQNELTHIRTPLFGSNGTLVSIPVPEGYEYSPVSALPLPDYQWYEEAEEDIRAGYRPMFKILEPHVKMLFQERLEGILTVIRSSFVKTKTLGEWALHILAQLFNVHGNLGIPILNASEPDIREIWALGMETLLNNDTRKKFIAMHADATSIIDANGFETGIGDRPDGYVPFYYECDSETCHRSRTELEYVEQGNSAILRGKCQSCGEVIEIEVSANDPDLSDIAHRLSPRVDTRQLIIDTSLPILAHAGGPGETAYYAQVIPAARELGYPFPLYVKYPRVFYNTPWNEDLGKELKEFDIPVLRDSEMFKAMGKVTRFRNKGRIEEMNIQLAELSSVISSTYNRLNESLEQLASKIDAEEKPSEDDLQLKLQLERYLSWVYGQYAPGKSAQESSWAWVDWALNAGLADLFGPYQRAYVEGMKHGATLFVNFAI